MSKESPLGGFPPLSEVMNAETGDYSELTLFENIVTFRVSQVMDSSPFELGLTADQLESGTVTAQAAEWAHIRAIVEAAYRLGLRDGLVRVGELA